jgi:D-sedoheptulose 7-phosphate isomerase
MTDTWADYVADINSQLVNLAVSDAQGDALAADDGFAKWLKLTLTVREGRRVVYFVGNGASAAMSSHMSADLAKNGRMHTQVLTDVSLMTALANDISYEDVFAFPLSIRANAGDMLIAISSSGGSPNVLKAAEEARRQGMSIVTLSAMKEDNPLRRCGDLNFFVPAGTYGYAESTHAAVLHRWMDQVEQIVAS